MGRAGNNCAGVALDTFFARRDALRWKEVRDVLPDDFREPVMEVVKLPAGLCNCGVEDRKSRYCRISDRTGKWRRGEWGGKLKSDREPIREDWCLRETKRAWLMHRDGLMRSLKLTPAEVISLVGPQPRTMGRGSPVLGDEVGEHQWESITEREARWRRENEKSWQVSEINKAALKAARAEARAKKKAAQERLRKEAAQHQKMLEAVWKQQEVDRRETARKVRAHRDGLMGEWWAGRGMECAMHVFNPWLHAPCMNMTESLNPLLGDLYKIARDVGFICDLIAMRSGRYRDAHQEWKRSQCDVEAAVDYLIGRTAMDGHRYGKIKSFNDWLGERLFPGRW